MGLGELSFQVQSYLFVTFFSNLLNSLSSPHATPSPNLILIKSFQVLLLSELLFPHLYYGDLLCALAVSTE